MPGWEGIEDSSAHPSRVWLARPLLTKTSSSTALVLSSTSDDGGDSKQTLAATTTSPTTAAAASREWTPLRKCDCQALNAAVDTAGTLAEATNTMVFIEGGRATADWKQGIIRYNFVRGPERQLCSALWFTREKATSHATSSSSGNASSTSTAATVVIVNSSGTSVTKKSKEQQGYTLHPVLNLSDEAKMEFLYQQVVEATSSLGKGFASIAENPELGNIRLHDESRLSVIKNGATLIMRKVPKGWFASQIDLQRGYGEYEVLGEATELSLGPVQHVCFVVHGIGEALFSRDDVKISSWIELQNTTRHTIQIKQLQQWKQRCAAAVKQGLPEPPRPGRVELIPIEWFNHLHDDSTSLMKSLKATTLTTIPALRAIANDVVFDVLMYLTPAFCEAVLECVTTQIHDLHRAFLQIHPEFLSSGGSCSLIGHSLGSVIAWDLLAVLKDNLERHGTGAATSAAAPATSHDGRPSSFRGMCVGREDADSHGYQAYARQGELHNKAQHGTWGPSLTKSLDRTLPFRPWTTILLGSPMGLFLSLRGAHAVFDEMRLASIEEAMQLRERQQGESSPPATISVAKPSTTASAASNATAPFIPIPIASPFSLPTGSLYNIFHPSDPVAYRIEPLLLSLDMPDNSLPPPVYLTALGKDVRFHLKARQFGDDLRKSIAESKNVWGALLESAVPFLVAAGTGPDSSKGGGGSNNNQLQADGPLVFPLGGSSARVDFSLQTGVIDNEYLSAVMAHSTYFSNGDLQDFLISLLATAEAAP